MADVAIPVIEMTREDPFWEGTTSDFESIDGADDAVLTGWGRDDVVLVYRASGSIGVTFTLDADNQAGRTNALVITCQAAELVVVPLRLFNPGVYDAADRLLRLNGGGGNVRYLTLRAVNPHRGGNHYGTASAGSRAALTVNELNAVDDFYQGDFTAGGDGDAVTGGTGAYVANWSADDLIGVHNPAATSVVDVVPKSGNAIGRTNDESESISTSSFGIIHCGLLEPEVFDQGGMLHLDASTDIDMTLIRARHIW